MELDVLLSDFLKEDDLNKLANDCGTILNCPLMVVDETFHIVAHFSPAGFEDKIFFEAINNGEIAYESVATIFNDDEIKLNKPRFINLKGSVYLRRFSPLITSNIHLGYLICIDINKNLNSIAKSTFSMIEAILAKQLFLNISKRNSIFETSEEILEHLLDGDFSSEIYFKIQSSSTYLADFKPKAFALIDLKHFHNLYFGEKHLREELMYNFYESHPFLYKGDVFMFLNDDFDINVFRKLAKEFYLKVVISDHIDSLYDLPKMYKPVHEALDVLIESVSQNEGYVYEFSRLKYLVMLHGLKDKEEFIDSRINKLAKYDEEKSSEYCETLYYYLISGRSLKETCEMMFAHRNTILYRIHRMKEELNIPIDDAGEQLNILLSLSFVLYKKYGLGYFLGI